MLISHGASQTDEGLNKVYIIVPHKFFANELK